MRTLIRRLLFPALLVIMLFSMRCTAFADTLTLPDGLREIEAEAFYGDTALDEVVIPYGVTSIGSRAFAYSSVRQIVIPATVTELAEDAFVGHLNPLVILEKPEDHFDPAFLTWCVSEFDDNDDGILSRSEALAVISIDCSDQGLTSLQGITAFSNLEALGCSSNRFTSLDLSGCSTLVVFACSYSQISSLNLSNCPTLQMAVCAYDQLTSLNVTGCTALNLLICMDNQLASLDLSDCPALAELHCNDNQLTILDVSGCPNLTDDYIVCDEGVTIIRTSVPINAAFFPDEGFRTYVRANFDADGDGALSENELMAVTEIDVSGQSAQQPGNITDLTGVKLFPNLQKLWFRYNSVEELDVSGMANLQRLNAYDNRLTDVDVSGCTGLTVINAGYNELMHLDVSGLTSLEVLYCVSNNITSLNLRGCESLQLLNCRYNQLTSIDVSECPNLQNNNIVCDEGVTIVRTSTHINVALFPDAEFRTYVRANFDADGDGALSENELMAVTEIDVSGQSAQEPGNITDLTGVKLFPNLQKLWFRYNSVEELDVSGMANLQRLNAYDNRLTDVDVSGCTGLTVINAGYNELMHLDVSGLTSLEVLYCVSNNITSLNLRGCESLQLLNCRYNQLTSIDVSECPNLQNNNIVCDEGVTIIH